MGIKKVYEAQNLLSLYLVSFLVGLRTYQHPCIFRRFCKIAGWKQTTTTEDF